MGPSNHARASLSEQGFRKYPNNTGIIPSGPGTRTYCTVQIVVLLKDDHCECHQVAKAYASITVDSSSITFRKDKSVVIR